MQETKYTMSLSIEDWEKVINGLTETERTSAKLRSIIITEINSYQLMFGLLFGA